MKLKPLHSFRPAPARCTILRYWATSDHLLAELHFPDSANFAGLKLVLFANTSIAWLTERGELDPHFYPDGRVVARFAPTERGLALGLQVLGGNAMEVHP